MLERQATSRRVVSFCYLLIITFGAVFWILVSFIWISGRHFGHAYVRAWSVGKGTGLDLLERVECMISKSKSGSA
jgi:hypothetical protein